MKQNITIFEESYNNKLIENDIDFEYNAMKEICRKYNNTIEQLGNEKNKGDKMWNIIYI